MKMEDLTISQQLLCVCRRLAETLSLVLFEFIESKTSLKQYAEETLG